MKTTRAVASGLLAVGMLMGAGELRAQDATTTQTAPVNPSPRTKKQLKHEKKQLNHQEKYNAKSDKESRKAAKAEGKADEHMQKADQQQNKANTPQ